MVEVTYTRVHKSGASQECSQKFFDDKEALRTLCKWNEQPDWKYIPLKLLRE
jgi:hypothetical protein